MTARTRARCCWTTALAALTGGAITAGWQPGIGIAGAATAVWLAVLGHDYAQEHRAIVRACDEARRRTIHTPDPYPDNDRPLTDAEQTAFDGIIRANDWSNT